MISAKKPLFTEPKVLVTGVEGAGKTLFAVQQADLLASEEGGDVYQINVRGADPSHLPRLPFALDEMAYEGGVPVTDPQTGDHLPRWALLTPGTVIIVDEAHKVFPQRGPGRPPKWVEMLAEGRQFGIRFIFLTQSPASMDAFVRDRIARHYHLERRGNMQRATILEFDHCVMYPRTAWQERKDAQAHFWAYPTSYYGWYQSAKVHSFRRRVPLKIIAAILFVPVAAYVAWRVYDKVGGVSAATPLAAAAGETVERGDSRRDRRSPTLDRAGFLKEWHPVVDTHPWSAPGFRELKVASQPEVYCASSAEGEDAMGNWVKASCSCITEQGTAYVLRPEDCRAVVTAGGVYNPYREPPDQDRATGHRDKPAEARSGPSGVRDVSASGVSGDQISTYGDFRPGLPATVPIQASGV